MTPRCPHCPHCREIAERADLRLTRSQPGSAPGVMDRAFYRDFGAAYDVARARSSQPMRLLREVNPDLTAARCSAYLKRARALGLVSAPARGNEPPPAPQAPRPEGSAPPEPRPVPVDDGGEVDETDRARAIAEARVRADWERCAGAPDGLDPALRKQWRDGIPVRPSHLLAYRLAATETEATAYLDELVDRGLGVYERTGVRLIGGD